MLSPLCLHLTSPVQCILILDLSTLALCRRPIPCLHNLADKLAPTNTKSRSRVCPKYKRLRPFRKRPALLRRKRSRRLPLLSLPSVNLVSPSLVNPRLLCIQSPLLRSRFTSVEIVKRTFNCTIRNLTCLVAHSKCKVTRATSDCLRRRACAWSHIFSSCAHIRLRRPAGRAKTGQSGLSSLADRLRGRKRQFRAKPRCVKSHARQILPRVIGSTHNLPDLCNSFFATKLGRRLLLHDPGNPVDLFKLFHGIVDFTSIPAIARALRRHRV
jgi:hypothetical protein